MKSCRPICTAIFLAVFACAASAQHGGGGGFHGGGGFSGGARGGFSAPHSGFSGIGMRPGMRPGSAPGGGAYRGPAFRSGFASRPGYRPMAPAGFYRPSPSFPTNSMLPLTRVPDTSAASATSAFRPLYHSANGFNHSHNDGFHDNHNHVVIIVPHNHAYGYWPWWGWGYPYAYGYYPYPGFFDDSDNYDWQPAPNYAAPQPPDNYYTLPPQYQPQDQPDPQLHHRPQEAVPAPPSDQPDDDQQQSPPPDPPAQLPNAFHHAPYSPAPSSPPAAPPVTLVFKDGRPPEKIYNYMLTPNTLTVLDENRRNIPVNQIDADATIEANLKAGVAFSIPVQ